MPQMGESIAEGTLSKWLKKVGDKVKRDEPIFEISTDKVDAEIPAPSAGVIAEIITTEGQTVPVNFVVARIETEAGAVITAAPSTPAPDAAKAAPAVGVSTANTSAANASAGAGSNANASPTPSSNGAHSIPATSGVATDFETRLKTKSSPLVRKIAAEHGVD